MDRLIHSRDLAADDGVALPFALLVAILLAMLSSLFIANALMENRASFQSEQHESTLHVAESGAEVGVERVMSAADPAAAVWDEPLPDEEATDLDALRSWAEEQAATVTADCDGLSPDEAGSCVVRTASGEATFLRPQSEVGDPLPLVLGVGYTPTKADPQRTRVVMLEFGSSSAAWQAEHAFLADGDVTVGGNVKLRGDGGSLHSNGDLAMSGGAYEVDGSLTWTEDGPSCGEDCSNVNGISGRHGPVALPEYVTALDLYESDKAEELKNQGEWVDLCPDGSVREPTLHAAEPCEGKAADSTYGWALDGATWSNDGNATIDSDMTYYIHGRDAKLTGNGSVPGGAFSIILERVDGQGGTFEGAGNTGIAPHYPGLLIWAEGDVDLRGTFGGTSELPGVIGAGGTVSLGGNFGSDGVAYLAYHHHDEDSESDIQGNPTIRFDGDHDFEFLPATATQRGRWTEL